MIKTHILEYNKNMFHKLNAGKGRSDAKMFLRPDIHEDEVNQKNKIIIEFFLIVLLMFKYQKIYFVKIIIRLRRLYKIDLSEIKILSKY